LVIKASSATQIEALVAELGAGRAAARESAVARLAVLGARAVSRLVALVESAADPVARVAALRALESIADPRAVDPALHAIDTPEAEVACAAVSVARVFLHGPRGASIVDRLTTIALDPTRDEGVRLSALEALGDLKPSSIAPIVGALRSDASDGVRRAAELTASSTGHETFDPAAVVRLAAESELPEDPAGLRRAVALVGKRVALAQLLRVIERVRDHEPSEGGARRAEWMRVRGAAHVALAGRGSRIALYDLRESIESAATPLPVELLAALSTIGDASCLEALAAAYARSMRSGGARRDWWRQHLGDTFRTIMKRSRVTRRHETMKKIRRRWPDALAELLNQLA
jgi:HEAT repeat protein